MIKKSGIVNGMYYESMGLGEVIIFLHGIGGTHRMFEPQVEFLSKNHRTITVDLKGHGKSISVSTRKYIDVHLESILDLMDLLNIKKAKFVGLSYGGIIVQKFAIKYPEKVDKMVLIDTYAHTLPRNFEEVKLGFFGFFVGLTFWMPSKFALPLYKPYKKWDLAYQEVTSISKNARPKDVTRQLMEVIGMNLLEDLRNLSIPGLVIVGDNMESVVNKSIEIAQSISNCELLVVHDSFDPTNLCQPGLVNEALMHFLTEEKKESFSNTYSFSLKQ